jgi:hypothetical protein
LGAAADEWLGLAGLAELVEPPVAGVVEQSAANAPVASSAAAQSVTRHRRERAGHLDVVRELTSEFRFTLAGYTPARFLTRS